MLPWILGCALANSTSLTPGADWVQTPVADVLDVDVGDFDGDGTTDIAHTTTDQVVVFYGAPTGLPSAPSTTWSTGRVSPQVARADVNGDGIDDLVVGHTTVVSSPGMLAVHLGTAAGLSSVPDFEVAGIGDLGFQVDAVGDLDGDGFDDVVAMEITSLRDHRWFRGSPTAGLEPTSWVLSGLAVQVVSDDVDGDGDLDLVGAVTAGLEEVSLFLGSAAGPSTVPDWSMPDVDQVYGVQLARTTASGLPDLVVYGGYPDATLRVFEASSTGLGAASSLVVEAPGVFEVLSGGNDLDGDGEDELTFGMGERLWFLDAEALPSTVATWPAPTVASSTTFTEALGATSKALVGDFDGDGGVDQLLAVSVAWDDGGSTSYGNPTSTTDSVLAVTYGPTPTGTGTDTGTAAATGHTGGTADTGTTPSTTSGDTAVVDTAIGTPAPTTGSTATDDEGSGCGCRVASSSESTWWARR